jgi:hypothetical protein
MDRLIGDVAANGHGLIGADAAAHDVSKLAIRGSQCARFKKPALEVRHLAIRRSFHLAPRFSRFAKAHRYLAQSTRGLNHWIAANRA